MMVRLQRGRALALQFFGLARGVERNQERVAIVGRCDGWRCRRGRALALALDRGRLSLQFSGAALGLEIGGGGGLE
jgi:hypothetical protein